MRREWFVLPKDKRARLRNQRLFGRILLRHRLRQPLRFLPGLRLRMVQRRYVQQQHEHMCCVRERHHGGEDLHDFESLRTVLPIGEADENMLWQRMGALDCLCGTLPVLLHLWNHAAVWQYRVPFDDSKLHRFCTRRPC